MEKQKTWIRVAGNASKIKANHPHGWRCYIKGNPTEIPLKNWFVKGVANQANFIPKVNPNGDEYGLIAWIDLYGSYIVKDQVLQITL